MRVGFLGLGNMGRPMARNLLAAGHQLTVWNRSRSKADELAAAGAQVAGSPAEAAVTGLAITMVADDSALEQVVFGKTGVAAGLPRGGVHVSMSTISAALAQRLAETHRENNQVLVSAPVFGRPEAAEAAKLFVVAAGPKVAVERCRPLFDAVGQNTFVAGGDPVMANVTKLAGNFLIASVLEGLGEAVALARKYDIDAAHLVDILTGTLFNAPIYKTYGGIIAAQKYQPAGFRLALGLKDVRLALAAAESVQAPLPFASIIRDNAVSAMALGLGDHDWSVLAKIAAERAGLK